MRYEKAPSTFPQFSEKLRKGARRLFVILFFVSLSALANLEGNTWIFHYDGHDYGFARNSRVRGTPLVCLEDLVQRFPLKLKVDLKNFRYTLTHARKKRELSFFSWSKEIEGNLDGKAFKTQLSKTMEFVGARPCVPIDFGDRALRPLLSGLAPKGEKALSKESVEVVIDPGHGGNDWGAQSKGVLEKDMVLRFAKDLSEAFLKEGVRSRLTRDEDLYLALPERAQIANASSAKLFLSLHMNADPTSRSRGYEIYVLSLDSADVGGRAAVAREQQMIPEDLGEGMGKAISDLRAQVNFEASLKLASAAQEAVKDIFPPTAHQGVRMGPFYVLYGALMPSLLLELGYVTSPLDREILSKEKSRKDLASKLAKKLAPRLKSP